MTKVKTSKYLRPAEQLPDLRINRITYTAKDWRNRAYITRVEDVLEYYEPENDMWLRLPKIHTTEEDWDNY